MPFTVEQFFDVFESYNRAIWPAQIVTYILGIIIVFLVMLKDNDFGRIISGILATVWLWTGVCYHLLHFSLINSIAVIFGIFFVLQGLLFILIGTIQGKLSYQFIYKPFPIGGAVIIFYAMVAYYLLGVLWGHSYPRAPVFGVAPCPVTIFTLGLFLWSKKPVKWILLIIPISWSLIGTMAAIQLRVPQDYGLGLSGLLVLSVEFYRRRYAARLLSQKYMIYPISKEENIGKIHFDDSECQRKS
jgi:hypothetical protein